MYDLLLSKNYGGPPEFKQKVAKQNLKDDITEWAESLSAAALQVKQQSPLYTSLITHSNALRSPFEKIRIMFPFFWNMMIFDIASYLPNSIVPQYEGFKETLLSWLNKLKKVKENAENDLKEIFNIHRYCYEGEWKKLDNTRLKKEIESMTSLKPSKFLTREDQRLALGQSGCLA
ncbi:hypothetical protein GYMLUDRAFT_240222 [Collybiopsis luxurians FD-317 M1]|nr:hypothetical protein GYMLUDRAFT_240222 [Collybiopsis luxurians FD-317 M1]